MFALIATVFGFLQIDGQIDHVFDFARGEVQQFQEVTVTQIKSHDEFSLYLCQTNSGSVVNYAVIQRLKHSRYGWRLYWCQLPP
ncbi:hypothetical protein D1872_308330 [compost metagenome]